MSEDERSRSPLSTRPSTLHAATSTNAGDGEGGGDDVNDGEDGCDDANGSYDSNNINDVFTTKETAEEPKMKKGPQRVTLQDVTYS